MARKPAVLLGTGTDPTGVHRQIGWWNRSAWFAATRTVDAQHDWNRLWADVDALEAEAKAELK